MVHVVEIYEAQISRVKIINCISRTAQAQPSRDMLSVGSRSSYGSRLVDDARPYELGGVALNNGEHNEEEFDLDGLDFDNALPAQLEEEEEDANHAIEVQLKSPDDRAMFMASDADLRRMIESLPGAEGLSITSETLNQSFYHAADDVTLPPMEETGVFRQELPQPLSQRRAFLDHNESEHDEEPPAYGGEMQEFYETGNENDEQQQEQPLLTAEDVSIGPQDHPFEGGISQGLQETERCDPSSVYYHGEPSWSAHGSHTNPDDTFTARDDGAGGVDAGMRPPHYLDQLGDFGEAEEQFTRVPFDNPYRVDEDLEPPSEGHQEPASYAAKMMENQLVSPVGKRKGVSNLDFYRPATLTPVTAVRIAHPPRHAADVYASPCDAVAAKVPPEPDREQFGKPGKPHHVNKPASDASRRLLENFLQSKGHASSSPPKERYLSSASGHSSAGSSHDGSVGRKYHFKVIPGDLQGQQRVQELERIVRELRGKLRKTVADKTAASQQLQDALRRVQDLEISMEGKGTPSTDAASQTNPTKVSIARTDMESTHRKEIEELKRKHQREIERARKNATPRSPKKPARRDASTVTIFQMDKVQHRAMAHMAGEMRAHCTRVYEAAVRAIHTEQIRRERDMADRFAREKEVFRRNLLDSVAK